jgi:hypothetical protein
MRAADGEFRDGMRIERDAPVTMNDGLTLHPDVATGSSNKHQWEIVDSEKWVPDRYAVARVDARNQA